MYAPYDTSILFLLYISGTDQYKNGEMVDAGYSIQFVFTLTIIIVLLFADPIQS